MYYGYFFTKQKLTLKAVAAFLSQATTDIPHVSYMPPEVAKKVSKSILEADDIDNFVTPDEVKDMALEAEHLYLFFATTFKDEDELNKYLDRAAAQDLTVEKTVTNLPNDRWFMVITNIKTED